MRPPTLALVVSLVFVLVLPGRGEDAPKEVPELKALKSYYQAEVSAALEPVRARYLAQLEALRKGYMERGDLTAVLAIQNAIDAGKAGLSGLGGALPPAVVKELTGGTWTWSSADPGDQNTIQFDADGIGSHGARGNTRWEVTGDREITIKHPRKGQAVIQISPDGQSFTGTGYNGLPVSGKRFN